VGLITPARLGLAEAACASRDTACGRMLPETHLARRHNISTSGLRDYAGAIADWRLRGERYHNDPRLFELNGYISAPPRPAGGRGCRNCSARWSWTRDNIYTLQQIALSYQNLGAMTRRSLRWIGVSDQCTTNVENAGSRGLYYVCWKADTRPLRQSI
jgi:hypothetical protein